MSRKSSFDAALDLQATIDDMTEAEADKYLNELNKTAASKKLIEDAKTKPIIAALFRKKLHKMAKRAEYKRRWNANKGCGSQ